MKNFVVKGESEGNLFAFELHIQAESLSKAQDKFFQWISQQPVYSHMWRLQFEFRELGSLK